MMHAEMKKEKDILIEFFSELKKDSTLDQKIVTAISDLYESGKLTGRSLTEKLTQMRKCDEEKDEN